MGTSKSPSFNTSFSDSSSVEITWISDQYWVLGQSGISLLTGDWDRECDRVLLDASISSGPFQPFSGVRVWPSNWTVAPEFWPSRLLDWAAINTEMLTISLNYQISPFTSGAWAYARKLRNNGACASHISQWLRDLSDCQQQTPSQVWRVLLTWEQVLGSPIKPPD